VAQDVEERGRLVSHVDGPAVDDEGYGHAESVARRVLGLPGSCGASPPARRTGVRRGVGSRAALSWREFRATRQKLRAFRPKTAKKRPRGAKFAPRGGREGDGPGGGPGGGGGAGAGGGGASWGAWGGGGGRGGMVSPRDRGRGEDGVGCGPVAGGMGPAQRAAAGRRRGRAG